LLEGCLKLEAEVLIEPDRLVIAGVCNQRDPLYSELIERVFKDPPYILTAHPASGLTGERHLDVGSIEPEVRCACNEFVAIRKPDCSTATIYPMLSAVNSGCDPAADIIVCTEQDVARVYTTSPDSQRTSQAE
jgi:hypothetical protein